MPNSALEDDEVTSTFERTRDEHSGMRTIHVIDSYTGGEATRRVISGLPDPGKGNLVEQGQHFRNHLEA